MHLEKNIREIYATIELELIRSQGEITPEIEELYKELDDDLKAQINWLGKKYIKEIQEAKWYKEKADNAKETSKSKLNSSEFWKSKIDELMQKSGRDTISVESIDVKYNGGKSLITNGVGSVPEKYVKIKTTKSVDAIPLKRDISNGVIEATDDYYIKDTKTIAIE